MEIGVYNGENAVSMVKSAIHIHPENKVEYYGFDFFHRYSTELIGDKLNRLGCFYKLFKGDTVQTVTDAIESLPLMDLIFIDGGKSYEEAHSDWTGSSRLMHDETGVFVHNIDFSGVGRMVEEISSEKYTVEKFYVRYEGMVAMIQKRQLTNI
jgi:predicted O-methyltransferase YrrM